MKTYDNTLYSIVEGLNRYYLGSPNPKKEGSFILHKTITSNPVIKSIKIYETRVWFVSSKDKTPVIGVRVTFSNPSEAQEEMIYKNMIEQLTVGMLQYINSPEFKALYYDKDE